MEQFDIFTTVVEQQSLNKASRLLNISQPALSRKIMRLEEELGVDLFRRKGKRLELTRAGEISYEFALEKKKLEKRFLQTLQPFKSNIKPDSIIIGASLTTLQSTLPELVAIYTHEYPNTDIKALTGMSHEIVTFVKEKKVSIGLVASKFEDPSLTCVPLFDDSLCLVIPESHPFADKTHQLSINSLHQLPMILFSRGSWYRVLMDEMFHRCAVYPDVKMEIDSFEAIIRLVSTCEAATLLPGSYLRSDLMAQNKLIVRYIPELEQTKRTTSLLFTEEAVHEPPIRNFINKAVKHYQADFTLE